MNITSLGALSGVGQSAISSNRMDSFGNTIHINNMNNLNNLNHFNNINLHEVLSSLGGNSNSPSFANFNLGK
jgi:hypothetical protein